jgi:glycosyltransferase involved in cell wall biosynthesis
MKVLIISYFYPPSNLTAANRPYYWAKYLAENGEEVTVITRPWSENQGSFSDIHQQVIQSDKITVSHEDKVRVIRMKEHDSFLRKMRNNSIIKRCRLSSFFTFLDIIIRNFFPSTSEFKFFEQVAQKENEKDNYDVLLISGGPHHQFYIGNRIKRQYPDIKWIADYRDEWNSMPTLESRERLLKVLDAYFEKKWTSNAYCFTYVNSTYINRLASFIKKKGYVIENGFNPPLTSESNTSDEKLVFTFLGTLYSYQEIDATSSLLKRVQAQTNKIVKINFIGSLIEDNVESRLRSVFSWCSALVLTKRIPREKTAAYIAETNFFLMFPFREMSGIVPTKVFDYLPYKKPILFFPKDGGKIDELLNQSNLSLKGDTEEEVALSILQVNSTDKWGNKSIELYSRQANCSNLHRLLLNVKGEINEIQ